MMKYVIAGAICATLTACAPGADAPPTLETILDRHGVARGGESALEAVHAVEVEIEIVEPSFTVSGIYRATRDGFMRIDVYADGTRVFTEALGPDGGWQLFQDDTAGRDLSPEGEAALRRGLISNLYGLHELPALGYELTFNGEQSLGSALFWSIERKAPDGFSETLFLDKDTYLVTRAIETSALHPDIDATEARFETARSDFRDNAGIVYANREEKHNLDTGEIVQTSTILARRINPDIDPSLFRRPE